MDITTSSRFFRKLEFEKRENGNKQGETLTAEAPEETTNTAPETKPVTASIAEVMAAYNKGEVKFVSTNQPITIPQGVSTYELDGNDITVYRKDDDIKGQVVGYDVNLKDLLKNFSDWKAVEPVAVDNDNTTNPSGVNGKIDEHVGQGGTGDCWLLTGVLALNSTEVGKNLIKSSITANADGSVTVNFKGVGVSYTISLDEIKKHDTDNIKNDAYSNGDNDMLVLELAVEKLKNDIASGKVKLDVIEDSYEGYNGESGEIEGGFPQQLLYFLTGEESTTATAKYIRAPQTPNDPAQTFIPESYINKIFNEALENGNTAITFGLYDGTHSAKLTNGKDYKLPLGRGGHALAITNLTKDTVTFVNPWDSTKEYTMSWSEFAKLGIGMIATTDLSGLEDVVEPDTPSTPTVDSDTERKTELISQIESDVERYLHTMVDDNQADAVRKEFNKLITGDENTNFLQYLHTQDLDVTKLEEIATAVANKINKTIPDEPVTPDPVNPDTPTDNGVAELKAQGFTQADIDEYFDKTEDGKYELKSGIKFSYYPTLRDMINRTNLTEKNITTIEELKEFCGANKRKALLDEGWPDELIDKYFTKTKQLDTGKTIYSLSGSSSSIMSIFDKHFEKEKQYTMEKDDNGNTIITVKKNYGNVKITVKADGTYTEEVEKNASCSTPDELKSKGFTQEQIDAWFEEVADGIYRIKNKAIATGDYVNTFNHFKSIEELAAYIGADSRVALRNQGMPDEIIDQFFELKRTGANGSFSYELKVEGNYTVTDQGENKLIRIQNKEDDTITEILVKKDGTYTIETSEIINIGESDNAKAVAGSANELLAQGFTQSDIDKYFYKKNNQYFLRSDITFRKEVVLGQDGKYVKYGYENFNITTLEELKEYSGANSRKALKDQGLPDELIDKFYRKEEGRDGKIVYDSNVITSIGKDGNNTVLTVHTFGYNIDENGNMIPTPIEEYTIKPDGTYTVLEYTSAQITDTTRTHYMLTKKGLSESDIQKFFTEKDGLYTLKKGIMYKGQYINSVEALVDALKKNNK